MYFITNSEGYIVAASKELLDEVGYRDICSIALAVKNKQFNIDSEKREMKISDSIYLYSKSSMYSAFGELSLYNLTSKSDLTLDEEDDNIEYLKRIKEGSVSKDDNNFNIPSIVKDEDKREELDNSINLSSDKIEFIKDESDKKDEIQIAKPEITIDDSSKEESIDKELKDAINSIPAVDDDKDEITIDKLNLEKIEEELKERPTNEKIEFIKDELDNKESRYTIEEELKKEKNIIEDSIKSIDKEKAELLDDELTLSEESTKIEEKKEDKDILIDDSVANLLKDIEEINVEKSETSKDKRDDVSESLYDSKERDEFKTDTTKVEDNIKDDFETEDKKGPLSKIKSKLFPWGSSDNEKEIELEESPIDNRVDDFDNSVVDSKPEAIDLDKLIVEEREEKSDELKSEVATRVEDRLTLEEEELAILKDIDRDSKKSNEIKEVVAIEPTNVVDRVIDDKITEDKQEATKQDFSHKIISMQVDSINIEENAKKLSIDSSNYKLLLENFLEELENYKDDLKSGVSSTISMLVDASELLSLNTITEKLKKIGKDDNSIVISEIELTKELLRDKISGKVKEVIVKKETIIEEKTEEKLATKEPAIKEFTPNSNTQEIIDVDLEQSSITPPIPQDAIDITSTDELLAKIDLKKIDFDPQRAVNELNLPKTLILEFVNDFISQAKDHLGQLVDAYKQNDIKTLQTTAHMLKGAASNLRLDPIAETLFRIQKSNNIEDSGDLLKKFVANLKGLEYEVNNLEKADNED